MSRQLLAGLAAAALGGCSLAPRYQSPAIEPVAAYREAGDWMPAQPSDAQPGATWWQAFGDPQLDDLERSLGQSNPDLRAAMARFEQARSIARRARSDEYPSLAAQASATRERTSTNAPLSVLTGSRSVTFNDFIAGLDLSWEVDLFGRLRNTAAAASAQAQASAADLAALELTVRAELASDYFALRGADANRRLLEQTILTYERAYEHTRDRYQAGAAAATDVDQADAQRQSARAQLSAVRLQRAELEHAIAVLLGQLASSFALASGSLAAAPPSIDAGLPSLLLQRRPDIASAERAMAAANAQIGVARAAWFPVFTFGVASAGYESVSASSWLLAPSRFWAVGPVGQLPLLDAGARSALTQQARAAYDEALANYRKATLTAYAEVEDSLAGLHHLADEARADDLAAAAARSAARHADERYDAGVADYLEVTATHAAALQAQRDAINARVGELGAAVALVRATGGGWSRDELKRPAAP